MSPIVSISPIREQKVSQLISQIEGFTIDPKSADILDFCQAMSVTAWAAYVRDDLICCWGLIPPSMLSNQAYLWMHSTPAIREHQFCLVRHSQVVLAEMLKVYDQIIGECVVGAKDSIRWLRWLGAEFAEAENGYLPFVIRSKVK